MQNRNGNRKLYYEVSPWKIIEEGYHPESNYLDETVFALGNGNIGTRGTFEEGYDGPMGTTMEGTYLNGFFERVPIHYDETAYGYATHTETMLNIPNGKLIQVHLEDEVLSLFTGTLESYRRELDLKEGILRRYMRWVSPAGRIVHIETERMVSLADDRLMLIRYAITPVNFSGKITLTSMLNGHVHNQTAENDPRIGTSLRGQTLKLQDIHQEEDCSQLLQITTYSKMQVLSAISHKIESDQPVTKEQTTHGQTAEHRYSFTASQGVRFGITKAVAYIRSDRTGDGDLWLMSRELLERALQHGWSHYHLLQRTILDDFWLHCDVEIEGDDVLQQGIRFNLFHLFQSAGKDGKTNIGAKGITGEGYQGHYFWDSEIYVLPFFTFTQPWVARKLLQYRYSTLDKARERAWTLFRKPGALYPWRTITGIECSSYFPAGTAQYHINADIVHAIKQFMEVTGDREFLYDFGAEMVLETARIWLLIGTFSESHNGAFCINTVTGPDEYSAMVNNNYYTNAMAKQHLHYAAVIFDELHEQAPDVMDRICRKIKLSSEEVKKWRKAAEAMYLPKDETLQIHPQDDSFLGKAPWPFHETPEEHYPLLLHYHPLDIYRHQVCKQADVVLAMYLLHDQFTKEEKQANLHYYEPLTTHDSSLSTCVFGILAAETGDRQKAFEYFKATARLDLDDTHSNAHHGIHTASMAGTWLSLVAGFAGLRMEGDLPVFSPMLPEKWSYYRFRLRYRGQCISMKVERDQVTTQLLEGPGFQFRINEQTVVLDEENVPETVIPLSN